MNLLLTPRQWHALRVVLPMLRINRRSFWLSVLLASIGLASSIALGATSAWLIARASQHPPVLTLSVAATSVRMFGVLRALMRYIQRLASHRVALEGMDNLRLGLYDHLAAGDISRSASLKRGDLLARTGADVDEVGDFIVKAVLPAAVSVIVGVLTVAALALFSPAAAAILALCLLISGLLAPLLTAHSRRLAQEEGRQARTQLAESVMTIIDGADELRVSGRIATLHAHVEEAEDQLTRATARAARTAGIAGLIDRLAMGAAVVGALLVGIPETTDGLLAAVALAVIVLTPLPSFEATSQMPGAAVQLIRSAQAAERILDLIGDASLEQKASSAQEAPSTHTFRSAQGVSPDQGFSSRHEAPSAQRTGDDTLSSAPPRHSDAQAVLRADNLAIGWPGGKTLAEGITLEVCPGRHVAIVGPSGIGKTTLLMTLCGLIPPHAGSITLNGVSLHDLTREEITSHISMTAEDAHIFATSVLENLKVARTDVTPEEAHTLLERAGLSSWLASLPQGLDTPIGTDGTGVSGGERRRLLVARALASPAPLMLLDEAGEHLDPRTADTLITDLFTTDPTRGSILVTHRLSALDAADEVLVMGTPAGDAPARILERGTHSDVLARSHTYRWAAEQEIQ